MARNEEDEIIGVADATSLIGLSMVGHLALLEQFVDRLVISPAVWDEVVVQGQGRPGSDELQSATFIETRGIQNGATVDMLHLFLGRGEAESLVLAQEVGARLFISDDLRARRTAEAAAYGSSESPACYWPPNSEGFSRRSDPFLTSCSPAGSDSGKCWSRRSC